jgi:hypothetical protein
MSGAKDELLSIAMTLSNGLLTILALVILIDVRRAREIIPVGLALLILILVYEWRERRDVSAGQARSRDGDD